MLIILDRDGVINVDSDDYIKSPKEWEPIAHSLSAIARLNEAGHTVVVATNQSGVGRGYFTQQTLDAIHEKMREELAAVGGHLQGIYFCPHSPDDHCACRKPKAGLLLDIARDFKADLKQAYVVGDSLRDIQAAHTVGALPILVRTGKGKKTLQEGDKALEGVPVYKDLAAFVGAIVAGVDS